MEDTAETTGSPSLSDFNQLRHRYSLPDVPEDVEDDMLHFNDPNWDFNANSSTLSISTDGVEHKRWSKSSTYMGPSSEVDTELQDSKAEFSSEGTQVQCALLFRPLYCACSLTCFARDSPYPEVRAAVANTDDPTMVVNTFRV
jgi:hypothetical protein